MGIEEAVREVVGERERERDTVGERVKGKVVAIPVLVIDVVGVGVKGKVVAIGDGVRVTVTDFEYVGEIEYVRLTVGDLVKGKVVGIPEAVPVMLCVRETVTDVVGVGVKGNVVGIPVFVRVTVTDCVRERDFVMVKETVPDNVGGLEG